MQPSGPASFIQNALSPGSALAAGSNSGATGAPPRNFARTAVNAAKSVLIDTGNPGRRALDMLEVDRPTIDFVAGATSCMA